MKSFNFIKTRKIWYALTLILAIGGAIGLLTAGLNLGIDFTSGTLFWFEFNEAVSADGIAQAIAVPETEGLNLGKGMVQRVGPKEFTLRVPSLDSKGQQTVIDAVKAAYPTAESHGIDQVDPRIGSELTKVAIESVLIASIGILIYIAFRFEYRFAAVSVLTLAAGVLITIGVFVITRQEVNSAFIAGMLTLVGYCVNNTIIIFDRVRENLRSSKKEDLAQMTDRSIKEMLGRTMHTTITTLIGVLALFIFGSSTIRDFTLALLTGLIVGVFLSMFVAGPLWYDWRRLIGESKPKAR